MKETEAIIERVRQVNKGFQRLELAVEPTLIRIKPGQTLLARLADSWDPYLREHWWPVSLKDERLVIERPIAENYTPGQIINVIGLVGQPYRFRRSARNVLLLAFNTPPIPLLMTIPWLLGNKISVTLVLVGSAREYTTEHLPPEVEIVHGEDNLNWSDQVMTVGWADQVFVTVAQEDEPGHFKRVIERFEERRAAIPQHYLFGVFRPPLPCGTGACQSCMLRLRKDTPLVCTDGPAFDLTQVVLR
jgi:hypothetical protein